ncbi:TPA: hypothetical protein N0F65_003095 [Lagenidium giganteum]|uniref:Uncharacterized protein n=1 Tax=Lagenidium giganteum TaxID=4803 RepID=A0AAV2YXG3_9STRA|nr:TPA: hypothetical protein N0F65_003095 [Lagenidium giganteum]
MVVARALLVRCVKAAASQAVAKKAFTHAAGVRVAAARVPVHGVRCCSSSRFLSLADDDDEGKKKKRGDDDEGDDGGDELSAEGEEGEEDEEKDGEVVFDEDFVEINMGGVDICEETDNEIMDLHMKDPLKWTTEKLARKYHYSKARVEAVIYFKGLEAGLELDELKAKIAEAKEAALQRHAEEEKQAAAVEASGDERAVKRLHKRQQQEEAAVHEIEEQELVGEEEEVFRNPEFFFLNDEFEGYPPLVRRLGKHAATDKLYPQEAVALQKMAVNNQVELLKSFAKPTDTKSRWKFAIKDTSKNKNKKALYVRDEEHTFRLATDKEVLPRTWVRRPAYFGGMDN